MSLPAENRRCTYETRKGNRCRNPKIPGHELCYLHSHRLHARVRSEAEFLKNKARPETAEGIYMILGQALRALARGDMPPRRATAVAYLCQTMLANLDRLSEERRKIETTMDWKALEQQHLYDASIDRLTEKVLGISRNGDSASDEAAGGQPPTGRPAAASK